jgi:lipoprotein
MKNKTILNLLIAAFALTSCSKESPELLPCMCDGTESTLGIFDCMCEPMKKKPVRRISYIKDERPMQTLIIDDEQRDAYLYLHQRRDSFAPVKLEFVDFRIKKGRKYDEFDTKLGNYRFRIFGCRRESKNVFLNKGRAMQKDMHFFDIFFEQMNDYYPVVVDKSNPYYLESDRIETPEYIVTAEITDYFMNICDEFDWNNVKQNKLRSGTSEMTVTWRVMNLTRDEVYCKGVTTGYGQISEGEPNGETLLVERAFEDALNKLPEVGCFNSTVSQRVRPDELARQLTVLKDIERRNQTFKDQYETELKGVSLLQNCASGVATDAGLRDKSIFEHMGINGNGRFVRGRIESGRFVEDAAGTVVGYFDEKGNFVETSGSKITGRYENGKFIEDSHGTIVGHYENGKFIEDGYIAIEESSGIYSDGRSPIERETLVIADGIDERHGIKGSGYFIKGHYDEKGNFVEDSKGTVIGHYENGKFVEDSSGFSVRGRYVDGRFVEDPNGTVVGHFDSQGRFVEDSSGFSVRGRYVDGRFVEDPNGPVVGHFDSRGRFVEDSSGVKVVGRYVDGRFIEDSSGNVIGHFDEKGYFIEDRYIQESAGYSVRESAIDSTGGVNGTGNVTERSISYRERLAHNGRTAGLVLDQECRAIEINDANCTVVKNVEENVTIADDYWIDVPLNTTDVLTIENRNMAEQAFANANNRFCIKNQAPYESLNPYNLYKIRASVVAVENARGKKGAGLIIADNLILTSADLMVKDNNNFNIQTINGKHLKATALRVNPNKNIAILLLDQPTQFTPLPLSLQLPEVNRDILLTLGMLDLDKEGEGYIDNEGKVIGYRWSEERGAEIIVDTFVQSVALGGALIDKNGNIVGIAHESKKLEDSPDLFIPIETALKSVGMEICGREFSQKKPAAIKTYETPLADAIDNSGNKAPKVMKGSERK